MLSRPRLFRFAQIIAFLVALSLLTAGAYAVTPTAPTLSAPASGSTVTPPVTFSWSAVTGATAYTLQFARDKAFKQPAVDGQEVTGTSVTISSFPAKTTIYWRVAGLFGPPPGKPGQPEPMLACPVYIMLGPWSAVWSFTTPAAPPPPPLTAPTLTAPATGSTVTNPVTFSWTAVAGATGYEIQFAKDKAFKQIAGGQPVSGTSVPGPKFPAGVTLYWRVAAVAGSPIVLLPIQPVLNTPQAQCVSGSGTANPVGPAPIVPPICPVRVGPWSAIWSFTVAKAAPPALTAPTLLAPANGSTVMPPLAFSWTAVPGAAGYQIQFSTSPAFATAAFDLKLAGTSVQIGSQLLKTGITLYWRVQALAPPTAGPWSSVWSFTIGTPPPPAALTAPVLASPADQATGVSTAPLLEWEAVTGAAGYTVQVSTNENFSGKVFIGQVADVQKQLTGLAPGGTYYWRVQARAQGATSPWSDVWSFTTVSANLVGTPVPGDHTGGGGTTGSGGSGSSGGSTGTGSGGSGTVIYGG